jgi:hypothetical protein
MFSLLEIPLVWWMISSHVWISVPTKVPKILSNCPLEAFNNGQHIRGFPSFS